ncbi:hypothetical protein [Frankia sp. R82]|uniref:hypothetical protein n=1 Tax=Frankia sp. R82 TaxID=2950553 RepID=UPI002042D96B|nr:hypothetical protein [Frankia sp. R82]MCM3884478.1 hypothetical protein [Frankia sp. R82]
MTVAMPGLMVDRRPDGGSSRWLHPAAAVPFGPAGLGDIRHPESAAQFGEFRRRCDGLVRRRWQAALTCRLGGGGAVGRTSRIRRARSRTAGWHRPGGFGRIGVGTSRLVGTIGDILSGPSCGGRR